jgi:hypothetical protein
MQADIADLGVAFLKLDPDVRKHAGGGHGDLLWLGHLGAETTPLDLDKQRASADRRDGRVEQIEDGQLTRIDTRCGSPGLACAAVPTPFQRRRR